MLKVHFLAKLKAWLDLTETFEPEVVRHFPIASFATVLFLPHFDIVCDLLLNRHTATWNLFVTLIA